VTNKNYIVWNNKRGVGKSTITFHVTSVYVEQNPDRNVTVFRKLLTLFMIVLLLPNCGFARDINASLSYLPKVLESPEEGVFIDLLKAIDNVYTEGKINVKIYPSIRAVMTVINEKADFMMPMLKNTVVPEEKLPYRYVTEPMGKVVMVIYSHKDSPITRVMIEKVKKKEMFPYRIDVIRGIEHYFDFPTLSSNAIDHSLKKVNVKRTDAFIMAQEEADHKLKKLNLKSIHRSFYHSFDDVILISKGPKGDEIDRILSGAIRKLKANGEWQKKHLKVHLPYQDWQIYTE